MKLRDQQIEDQKYGRYENVASLVFKADSQTGDDVMVKALDQKYNTLLDKLLLESLEKQMGKNIRIYNKGGSRHMSAAIRWRLLCLYKDILVIIAYSIVVI